MKLNLSYLVFFIGIIEVATAQNVPVGEWRAHGSYVNASDVAAVDKIVYCVANKNLFSYNSEDNSITRFSKVNGLSDVNVNKISYQKSTKTLVITYDNCNIDLLTGDQLLNLSDIKRKQIVGKKTINAISFIGDMAYLSCGFGIVVLDLMKKEVKDTYFIGKDNSNVNVNDIAADASGYIYAASDDGVYRASLSNQFLALSDNWVLEKTLPNKPFNAICSFKGQVYANAPGAFNRDKFYVLESGVTWKFLDSTRTTYKMFSKGDTLLMVNYGVVSVYKSGMQKVNSLYAYSGNADPKAAVCDDYNRIWIADRNATLVKNFEIFGFETIVPEGPASNTIYDLSIENGSLWTVPGMVSDSWSNTFNAEGVSNFFDNDWKVTNGLDIFNNFKARDLLSIRCDPKNTDIAYAGSWEGGLLKFEGSSVTMKYDETNSSLKKFNQTEIRVGGLDFDSDGNLWMSNSQVRTGLNVLTKDGTWFSYSLSSVIGNLSLGKVLATSLGQKWIVIPSWTLQTGGLIVYDEHGTIEDDADDKIRKLTTASGNGGLPGMPMSIAEDKNGEIWVGTEKGVAVFYNPATVFDESGFDCEQVKIEIGGHVQLLLETEMVNSIEVDGANRKWIGTTGSGVYLMNEDGTEQLLHFTDKDSPLPSNNVYSIKVDHTSGEVYMSTEKGMVSFKYTATVGAKNFDKVYAYPNPVKENYDGLICIKGLTDEAEVRITDVAGNLVHSSTAFGGQAVWNGANLQGKKVKTGIYLVFCVSKKGEIDKATKIMVVR